MKTRLIVVGKTSNKQLTALINDYIKRISHYAPVQMIEIKEERNDKNVKEKEADKILDILNPNDYVVLLDERGEQHSSIAFSQWLNKRRLSGKNLALIVGGAYGFSQRLYDKSDEMLSLSKMTFSHEMVRLFITEQIYRACTILKGESYHHE